MGSKITKNTIDEGFKKLEKHGENATVLAIERGLEVLRSSIVPLTPIVSGRLAGSIQGKPKKEEDDIFSVKKEGGRIIGRIGSAVEYAAHVEFNSKRNRGFFTRGFKKAKNKAIKAMKNTLKFK